MCPLLPAGLQLPPASGHLFVNQFANWFRKSSLRLCSLELDRGGDAERGAKLQTMFEGVFR